MSEIDACVQQPRALGTSRFQAAIEAELRRVATVPRGGCQEGAETTVLSMNAQRE
jgi:hypothetical protein